MGCASDPPVGVVSIRRDCHGRRYFGCRSCLTEAFSALTVHDYSPLTCWTGFVPIAVYASAVLHFVIGNHCPAAGPPMHTQRG